MLTTMHTEGVTDSTKYCYKTLQEIGSARIDHLLLQVTEKQ